MKLDKDQVEAEEALVKVGSFLVRCERDVDEQFCQMVAAGVALRQAARETGACHEKSSHLLIRKPHIIARINYIRHTACAKVDVTVDGLMAELLILKEQAWQRGDHKAVQSIIGDIARLGGLDQERSKVPAMGWKEVVETMAEAKGITLDQMRQIARAEAAKNMPDLPPPHKVH